MNYWIFQGNPDQFRIDDYVNDNQYMYWTVKLYTDEYSVGDIVYLWRAKGKKAKAKSGIMAICEITETTISRDKARYPEYLGDKYWTEGSPKPSEQSQVVGLRLLENRMDNENGFLPISYFKNDEILSKHQLITARNPTNYKLSPSENAIIEIGLFHDQSKKREQSSWVVITENDQSDWDDVTGVSYNYPAKYSRLLRPGVRIIYYKGRLKDKAFESKRLSNDPYYFGVGVVGESYADEKAEKNEYYCDILQYEPFDIPVSFKENGEYIETIPENKASNYWRDGVREISKETYDRILNHANKEFNPAPEISHYRISARKFKDVFNLFPNFVRNESGGQAFNGFTQGYLHERESYKEDLRDKSLQILDSNSWTENIIGSGDIVRKVIKIFELPENNLVGTRRKFGPENVPHIKMIHSLESGDNLKEIETNLYKLFKTNDHYPETFDELVKLIGKQYSILAFLFYLRNNREYLPISTSNFEYAFQTLGCDLKLTKKCSWENYIDYIAVLKQVQSMLEGEMNEDLNLIDAHSFCWLIGYNNRFAVWKENSGEQTEVIFRAFEVKPINNEISRARTTPNSNEKEGDVDWDKEQKRKQIRGRRAEELVIEFEKKRLSSENKPELAEKVDDYSKRYSKGFDVLSFNADGSERNIEVKASSGNSFIITRNELIKSESNPNYWIYIVFEKKNEVQIKQIKAPTFKNDRQFKLEPKDYYVSFSVE